MCIYMFLCILLKEKCNKQIRETKQYFTGLSLVTKSFVKEEGK